MTDLRKAAPQVTPQVTPEVTGGVDLAKVGEVGVWGDSQALAEPQQEPVAWMYTSHYKGNEWFITRYQSELTTYKADKVQPLYTAPPKREWVGLTEDEVTDCFLDSSEKGILIEEAIEAKLKEKNT